MLVLELKIATGLLISAIFKVKVIEKLLKSFDIIIECVPMKHLFFVT